jgi:acyl carrier protein
MSSEMVREKVIRVFSEFKKIPPEEITDATTFEQLGFDSLDGLNLIFELEEQFDLVIPDDKAQSMKSVGQVIDGIETMLAEKEA